MEQFEEIPIPEIEEKNGDRREKCGKRKLAVGIASACVVLFIVAGIVFAKVYYSEERALIKGILNLAEELDTRQQLWEAASGNLPDDPLGCIKMTTVFNVSSEELPVTLGVDTILLRDTAVRMMQTSTEVSIMNNKLIEMTVDGNEDTLTIALPVFFKQNLAFDTAYIDRQYNNSLLAEKFGRLEDMELSIELFPENPNEIWEKYYVSLMKGLQNIKTEGFKEIKVEKLESPLVINVQEKEGRQYQCSQYRVTIPYSESDRENTTGAMAVTSEGEMDDCISFFVAVDENDRIVQISLEEPVDIPVKYQEADIDVKLEGNICFLGEERSIDDIVVNMQLEIPLDMLPFNEDLLSSFGNEFINEEDVIELQAKAEIVYHENDSSVTTELNKLTVKVDRIGSFTVSGKIITEPLHETIEALEGDTIRIFEITEEQYQDLEAQFLQRIWRWLKALGR